ncbi:MAG: DUF2262 domain-containing protein [Planctomycetaceae bacterium]|nr:DUF2262 domain-containing protein [Planctomycetaceae bacterium]
MSSNLTLTVRGHTVRVLDGHYTSEGKPTSAAEQFAEKIIAKLPTIKKFATQQLLETFNDVWAEDEVDELTPEQFAANLTSPKIVLADELGAASIYFSDSDMFGGHLIDVWINKGKIADASLQG